MEIFCLPPQTAGTYRESFRMFDRSMFVWKRALRAARAMAQRTARTARTSRTARMAQMAQRTRIPCERVCFSYVLVRPPRNNHVTKK